MKQLLVFLFLLCSTSIFAQDVIVKKDGSTIVCRIVELTSTEITYKKWSDLNGSNYVMNRADASAVNYENGKKVNLSEATNLYQPHNQNDGVQQYNDKALLAMDFARSNPYKKAKTQKTIGWIGGGTLLVAGVVFYGLYRSSYGPDARGKHKQYNKQWALPLSLSCVGGAAVWTTTFLLVANNTKKKAESQLSFSPILQHDIPLSNGSSLSLGADLLSDRTMGNNTLGLGLRYNF